MSGDPKRTIAARAALELQAGEVVNLGIGIPNMIPMFLDDDAGVYLHTENGLLGVGPRPDENELDRDMIDAAKRPVTALPGASYFDSAESFAMIRGGHIDVAVLGALQVSAGGDIANWAVPGQGRARRRRRDGSRRGRRPRDRDDDGDVVERRAQGRARLHLSADREGRRRRRDHRALASSACATGSSC